MVSANLEEGYWALREDAGAVALERDVVRVSGPDAERYLQGQTSQDIVALRPGSCAWALVLQPQGRLDAFVRVYRAAPDEFLLLSDGGVGEAIVARLDRFRLRTKVAIEQLDWRVVGVRGPAGEQAVGEGQGKPTLEERLGAERRAGEQRAGGQGAGRGRVPLPVASQGCLVLPFAWRGLAGYDLVGPGAVAPAGLPEVGAEAYEAVRIEAGLPAHGAELDGRTIPAEAGLVEACVSFTKGCYTGQELVARIDSRGTNVPRRLRGLLLTGPAEAGAPLVDAREHPARARTGQGDEKSAVKEVGAVTSVAFSPRLGWVALGYVGRAVDIGTNLLVTQTGEGGSALGDGAKGSVVSALVESLPF